MKRHAQTIFPTEIISVATAFPKQVRTNDFWVKNYPDVVAKSSVFTEDNPWGTIEALAEADASGAKFFHKNMFKYLNDPFRGCKERRVLAENEESIQLEVTAIERALKAAKLKIKDIDLILLASFTSQYFIVGNGAYLASGSVSMFHDYQKRLQWCIM